MKKPALAALLFAITFSASAQIRFPNLGGIKLPGGITVQAGCQQQTP